MYWEFGLLSSVRCCPVFFVCCFFSCSQCFHVSLHWLWQTDKCAHKFRYVTYTRRWDQAQTSLYKSWLKGTKELSFWPCPARGSNPGSLDLNSDSQTTEPCPPPHPHPIVSNKQKGISFQQQKRHKMDSCCCCCCCCWSNLTSGSQKWYRQDGQLMHVAFYTNAKAVNVTILSRTTCERSSQRHTYKIHSTKHSDNCSSHSEQKKTQVTAIHWWSHPLRYDFDSRRSSRIRRFLLPKTNTTRYKSSFIEIIPSAMTVFNQNVDMSLTVCMSLSVYHSWAWVCISDYQCMCVGGWWVDIRICCIWFVWVWLYIPWQCFCLIDWHCNFLPWTNKVLSYLIWSYEVWFINWLL